MLHVLALRSARAEDDRKPEFCKKMLTTSKTFRPGVALQRSPFFPEIILSVTDWAFFLWKDGLKTHFFQSPAPQSYFTSGTWSPTRPSVLSGFGCALPDSLDMAC